MHNFLERMLILQKVSNIYIISQCYEGLITIKFYRVFVELADDSEEVPSLKGKQYANFHLDHKDWQRMKQIKEVLQVCKTFHYLLGID